ncbi:hypothetical protein [Microbacterium sp. 22242]|uniref:hypothetical protein n=1 Tax=Microbacterium sp. 22242 TaxID=3453896 RepID=UPI003F85C2D8
MTSNEQPMTSAPVSAEEAERRKAMLAEFLASNTLPPLYRLSTMNPEVTWGPATYGSPTPISQTRFVYEIKATTTPRLEVHTLEFGTEDEIAVVSWGLNFGGPPPAAPTKPVTIPVTVDTSPGSGRVLATVSNRWMVAIKAPNGSFVVLGPGDLPRHLTLIRTDIGTPS